MKISNRLGNAYLESIGLPEAFSFSIRVNLLNEESDCGGQKLAAFLTYLSIGADSVREYLPLNVAGRIGLFDKMICDNPLGTHLYQGEIDLYHLAHSHICEAVGMRLCEILWALDLC